MMDADCRPHARMCQVARAVLMVLTVMCGPSTLAADATVAETRRSIKLLKRLQRTSSEYHGPGRHRLLDAMTLEAVRLYESAKYDPALDVVLLAAEMYPENAERSHYGVQPEVVELEARWPTKDEAKLLPMSSKSHRWAMIAVANVSGVKLDLAELRATVLRNGRPLKGADGKPVESISPLDPKIRTLLGPKSVVLLPGQVNPGESAKFVVAFPAFDDWTGLRFVDERNRIDVTVRDYAGMVTHLARLLRARKLAATYEKKRPVVTTTVKPVDNKPPKVAYTGYVLIGYVRNRIAEGKYGIRLTSRALARKHRIYYVRGSGKTLAQLRRVGSGAIVDLLTDGYAPLAGDPVFVDVGKKKPN
jgi:hypothetical protein